MRGQAIKVSDAIRNYSTAEVSISQKNFSNWAKAGYIKVLGRGYRLLLDEADVAYCAKIYTEKYHKYGGQMAFCFNGQAKTPSHPCDQLRSTHCLGSRRDSI